MKRFVVFLLLTTVIFFPPVSIFFASRTARILRSEANEREQRDLALQDFQILEKRSDFSARVSQELSAVKEVLSVIPADGVADHSLLRLRLMQLLEEFSSRLDFPSEICAFYPEGDEIVKIRSGADLDLMPIVEKFCSKTYFELFYDPEKLSWTASGKDNFQRYMYRFIQMIKSKDVSQIHLSEGHRRRTFANTIITLTNQRKIAVFAIADLSGVRSFDALKRRLESYPQREYGIVAFDRSSGGIAFSNFFQEHMDKMPVAEKAIKRAIKSKILKHSGNERIYFEPKVSESGFFLLAIAPEREEHGAGSGLIIAFASILSCMIFKVMVEKLYLKRGPDLYLTLLIPGTFALLIIQPVFASIYLAEEYIDTSYEAKQTELTSQLEDDMKAMDKESIYGFRRDLNFTRSINSIEKMEKIVGQNLGSIDLKEFFLSLAGKVGSGGFGSKQVHFPSLWVYPVDQPPFAISRFFDGKLECIEEKSPVAEIFFNRFQEKLDYLLQSKKSGKGKISAGDLKMEFARDFFINFLGQDSFYKFRSNADLFLDVHSFYRHDYFLSFPIFRDGEYFAIINWHFNENSARSSFPKHQLSIDKDAPRIVLYGDQHKIISAPVRHADLLAMYPDLAACAREAHLSRSNMSQLIREEKGLKAIKAVPLGFTLYTGAGYSWLQSFKSFKTENMRSIALVIIIIFLTGMFIAWSGAKFFTEPIKALTRATEEINSGNFSVQIDDKHPDEFAEIGRSFNKMAKGLREGRELKKFVSGAVLKEVASGPDGLGESAKIVYATILFSGIKNFKELQKSKTAVEIFDLLQKHLSVASDAISQYGGEIDKMIEDKIMIVFEHEDGGLDNSGKAVLAAWEIQEKMRLSYSLEVSVGVNSGLVVSGVMGAEKARLAHTVVGDPVNLAARLAAEAMKLESGEIVISGELADALPENYCAEKLPINSVKGKTQSIEAYTLKKRSP